MLSKEGKRPASGIKLYQELMSFNVKVNKDLDQMNQQVKKLKNASQIANR